ncbi:ATP-binding cassette subfamily C protein CydC [Nocardia kruczakiae]|uniref:ATP-binding cassette subfamily C protein CydC n=1 Tax=Nocardia kruczakiae TaxID=261477 RepID=A0ABU1XJE2_9NOCA|nr:thiol reductant ABC exporter subunit CydC [Nocardia kruczakiae]MDR7170661.1 ATP-binding cassette subfamily C protein CydC [Nocardia kruczakiae]
MKSLWAELRELRRVSEISPWRVVVSICWGTIALGSGLALAALAAWLIARAWQMPPVLDLSVAVVAVRALGISRGLFRYIERLATHDVALRAMTTARTSVYAALARADFWTLRRDIRSEGDLTGSTERVADGAPGSSSTLPREGGGDSRDGGRAEQPQCRPVGLSPGGEVGRPGSGAGRGTGLLRRGDLLTRIGADVDDLGAVVVRAVVPIAVAILLSLAAVALLATISVPAGVILAVALLVSGGFAPWLSARAARDAELAVQSDRAEFRAAAVTVLDHAAELRVAGRLDAAMTAATTASARAVRAEDRAAARSAWAAAATPLSVGASVLGALLIGIMLYGNGFGAPAEPLQPAPAGGITPMAFAILVLLPLSAFEAVAVLPAAAQALTKGRAALRRIRALDPAESARAVATDDNASAPADYASGDLGARLIRALPDLPPGRRIAVVGPSGAGKTTLLMSWAGLFDTPRPGRTFFAEDAHVFGTCVLENLRVARGDVTDAEAENALRAVGSGPWLDALPEGVDTDLVGGAAALSGGQRRRLLLARALVAPADTLLLDEPTEHMEAAAGAELLRALLDETSGLVDPDRTVVVVTHQLPPDHRADTVVTVAPGGEISITRRVPA